LGAFAQVQEQIDSQVARLVEADGGRRNDAGSQIYTHFSKTGEKLKGRTLRTIFAATESFATALETYAGANTDAPAKQAAGAIRRFEEILDTFSTSRASTDAVVVLSSASRLQAMLATVKTGLEDIVWRFEPEPIGDDEDALTLTLEGDHTLSAIAEKLAALDAICDMVVKALEPHGLTVSFRAQRVESGSPLLIAVVALKIGVTALKQLLTAVIGYWYRNYTAEGQLKHSLPATIAALKDAVKLRNLLSKEGIDVAGTDDALAEQTEQLVQKIGILAGFEKQIKVDDDAYTSVASEGGWFLPHEVAPRLTHEGNRE
jgi:hypothetical protein